MKRINSTADAAGNRMGLAELLTAREREVCSLAALGHTNIGIARRLKVSAQTISIHRRHLVRKLGLHAAAELPAFAQARGLSGTGPKGTPFKQCPACQMTWWFRGEFLADPDIRFDEYRSSPADGLACPLWFYHGRCGTPLALSLEAFKELTEFPIFSPSCATGRTASYCLARPRGEACPIQCVCSYIRHVTRAVSRWPKGKARLRS